MNSANSIPHGRVMAALAALHSELRQLRELDADRVVLERTLGGNVPTAITTAQEREIAYREGRVKAAVRAFLTEEGRDV